jgi:hypothetical protein
VAGTATKISRTLLRLTFLLLNASLLTSKGKFPREEENQAFASGIILSSASQDSMDHM